MPDGSYESVGMMECDIRNNPLYPNLHVCKETVKSKNDFKGVVTSLVEQVSKETELVLHLCVHGDENGIAFKGYKENSTEGNRMLWDEFVQTIRPLNEALDCNLILVLQACCSSKLAEKLFDEKFCKYLIAGEGIVYSNDIPPFLQYYKTLAETQDAKLAYNAMISTKYYDVKNKEIPISSIFKLFQNDETK